MFESSVGVASATRRASRNASLESGDTGGGGGGDDIGGGGDDDIGGGGDDDIGGGGDDDTGTSRVSETASVALSSTTARASFPSSSPSSAPVPPPIERASRVQATTHALAATTRATPVNRRHERHRDRVGFRESVVVDMAIARRRLSCGISAQVARAGRRDTATRVATARASLDVEEKAEEAHTRARDARSRRHRGGDGVGARRGDGGGGRDVDVLDAADDDDDDDDVRVEGVEGACDGDDRIRGASRARAFGDCVARRRRG
jgi:hypothetical protein